MTEQYRSKGQAAKNFRIWMSDVTYHSDVVPPHIEQAVSQAIELFVSVGQDLKAAVKIREVSWPRRVRSQ